MVLDRRSPWKLKMDRGVAGIVGRITGAILPRETLLVGPRVEEGAIAVKCSSESNRRPRGVNGSQTPLIRAERNVKKTPDRSLWILKDANPAP